MSPMGPMGPRLHLINHLIQLLQRPFRRFGAPGQLRIHIRIFRYDSLRVLLHFPGTVQRRTHGPVLELLAEWRCQGALILLHFINIVPLDLSFVISGDIARSDGLGWLVGGFGA